MPTRDVHASLQSKSRVMSSMPAGVARGHERFVARRRELPGLGARKGVRALMAFLLVVTAGLAIVSVAGAATPIHKSEHFLGLVNGSNKGPVVKTVCPGPVGPNRTGRVAGKQTVSVVLVHKGGGYTGLFSSIYAWFQPLKSDSTPIQLRLKDYSTPMSIPTSVKVRCGGTGIVVFSSCPYLAPCAAGWVPDDVKVTFENIAA
jgi:hypothetical protein